MHLSQWVKGFFKTLSFGAVFSAAEAVAESSRFDRYAGEVHSVIAGLPCPEQNAAFSQLYNEWPLLSEEGKKSALKQLLDRPAYSNGLQIYSPPSASFSTVSEKDAIKGRKRIANIARPDGTPKPDLEGIAWASLFVTEALDDNPKIQENGALSLMTSFLSSVSDFLMETTETGKAAEQALTKHNFLYPSQSRELSRKIGYYRENDGGVYSQKEPERGFLSWLDRIGFGRVAFDVDANASKFQIDGVSMTLLRYENSSCSFLVTVFGFYDESEAFRYHTGKGYAGLTPLDE